MKIWFFEILCYGKHRIRFWGHSPCESMGHCASENVGEAYGGNYRSETLGSSSVTRFWNAQSVRTMYTE